MMFGFHSRLISFFRRSTLLFFLQLFLFFLFFITVLPCQISLSAQDKTEEDSEDKEPSAQEKAKQKAKEEKIKQSTKEERKEILKYGIDGEILGVIKAIKSEGSEEYNEELTAVLDRTEKGAVVESLFYYFADIDYKGAAEKATDLLQKIIDDEKYNRQAAIAALYYLGEIKSIESVKSLYEIVERRDRSIAGTALRAIGKIGDDSGADSLLKLLDDYTEEEQDIAADAILTLGELKYQPAFDILLELADNEDVYSMCRRYAFLALGKLGNKEALKPLLDIYRRTEKDAISKSFALKGLSLFEGDEVIDLLMDEGLRDNNVQIRVAACDGLAERKATKAIDILIYKAKKDPEDAVQKAAFKALVKMDHSKANAFLFEFFADKEKTEGKRLFLAKLLSEEKIAGTPGKIKAVMDDEWDDKKKEKKGFVQALAKIASSVEWNAFGSLYRDMLSHPDPSVKIYGIRGIKKNKLMGLYGAAKALSNDKDKGVSREAKSLD